MQQQKFPRPVDASCPSPDEGPLALILYRLQQLEQRFEPIEEKLHKIVGIWWAVSAVGGFVVGAAIVGTFFFSHFHFS